MQELKQTIGMLFKIKGANIISERDFIFSVSMDLRWLSPKEAQKLLEIGLQTKLLSKVAEGIKINFDYRELAIPLEFKPDKRILEFKIPEENLFLKIVDSIATRTGLQKSDIVSKINAKKDKLNIEIEVAALLIAAENDVKINRFLQEVEKEIFKRTRKS